MKIEAHSSSSPWPRRGFCGGRAALCGQGETPRRTWIGTGRKHLLSSCGRQPEDSARRGRGGMEDQHRQDRIDRLRVLWNPCKQIGRRPRRYLHFRRSPMDGDSRKGQSSAPERAETSWQQACPHRTKRCGTKLEIVKGFDLSRHGDGKIAVCAWTWNSGIYAKEAWNHLGFSRASTKARAGRHDPKCLSLVSRGEANSALSLHRRQADPSESVGTFRLRAIARSSIQLLSSRLRSIRRGVIHEY